MALLRNYVRLCARSIRPFCTEFYPTADLTSTFHGDTGRMTPRKWLMQSDTAINERLRNNEIIGPEGWITIRKELLDTTNFKINESTLDMTIVHLCLDNKKVDAAMDYLQFLWDSDIEMNLSAMMSYLKLCYVPGVPPNKTRLRYLNEIYNKIRKKYTVMDALTGECCIMGITQTDRWKEAIELMDIIKLSCRPRSVTYTAIIAAAFNNDEPEIGWKYLREVLTRMNAGHDVFTAYLNYCTRNFVGNGLIDEISKMFQFWGDRDIRAYVEVIEEYEKVLRANGWSADRTSIRGIGECWNCAKKLTSLKITPEQYAKLTQIVRERVIIGDDVYQKSTPKELNRFLRFMERTKPYDIVIDGLNVSYVMQGKAKPDGSQLNNVVRSCVRMGKVVLVLGRKHMTRWRKLDIEYINSHGDMFLAENSSADDPYLLYATLIRGPDTQFVSKDLMRQHKFLLEDPELTKVFKYWQMAHQLYPVGLPTSRGMRVDLKLPPTYLPVAQKDDKGWHVPYTVDRTLQPSAVYEPPQTWVCFRNNTNNEKIVESS